LEKKLSRLSIVRSGDGDEAGAGAGLGDEAGTGTGGGAGVADEAEGVVDFLAEAEGPSFRMSSKKGLTRNASP
jgi:hypothetical protein